MERSASVLARLWGPAFALAVFLVVGPLADVMNSIWPLQLGSAAWRYASAGLLSGSSLTIAMGMLLASAVAIEGAHRRVLGALVLAEVVAAAAFATVGVDFLLNAVELRAGATRAVPRIFDLGTLRVTAKYLLTAAWLVWLALRGRSALLRQRQMLETRGPDAPPTWPRRG